MEDLEHVALIQSSRRLKKALHVLRYDVNILIKNSALCILDLLHRLLCRDCSIHRVTIIAPVKPVLKNNI